MIRKTQDRRHTGPAQLSPAPVLHVIDDDRVVRRAMESMLRSAGHDVRSFSDGPEALVAFASAPPDVVLLDVMMPGMDGLDVLQRMVASDPEVSVVMLTALDGIDTLVAAMRCGAHDYLVKPVEKHRLLSTVRRAIEWTRLRCRVRDLEDRIEGLAASVIAPNAVELRTRSVVDLQTLEREAIENALRHTGGNVSEAARRLGIGRTTLYRKMTAFDL